jgi:hypothetical protein
VTIYEALQADHRKVLGVLGKLTEKSGPKLATQNQDYIEAEAYFTLRNLIARNLDILKTQSASKS